MIWRPRHLTRTQLEEGRLAAGRLWQAGHLSHAAIARQRGVSRTAVSTWAERLRQSPGDLRSLKSKAVPGRPPRLTTDQWQHLLQVLQRGALQAGFDTDRWTLRRIRALILVECGVEYHTHYLARRLNALSWSPQHPAVYAREREDALVQAWLPRDWPRIKKRLAAAARQSSSSMRPGFRFVRRRPPRGLRGGTHPSSGA
jgi:transposase